MKTCEIEKEIVENTKKLNSVWWKRSTGPPKKKERKNVKKKREMFVELKNGAFKNDLCLNFAPPPERVCSNRVRMKE